MVPAVLLGFLDGPTLGFMVIGLYVIIQQFENHLIYPLVVRKVVGVPPLLVILALIIGGRLAGFLGILLSAPIAAVIIEFTNDIQRENRSFQATKSKVAPCSFHANAPQFVGFRYVRIKCHEKYFLHHHNTSVCKRRPAFGSCA